MAAPICVSVDRVLRSTQCSYSSTRDGLEALPERSGLTFRSAYFVVFATTRWLSVDNGGCPNAPD
eukprot:scaffold34128_cov39-Cyclotella_meneghiniana.AAC.1